MSESRLESQLEALINGETSDIIPQSRIEQILKNCLESKGSEGLLPPLSRVEAYLIALSEMIKDDTTEDRAVITALDNINGEVI